MTDPHWALPESAPVESSTPPVGDPTLAAAPGPTAAPSVVAEQPERRAVPVLAVFDRPLTIADILDGGFEIIKARPRQVLTIACLFVLPLAALVALADPGIFGGDALTALTDPETYDEGAETSDGNFGLTIMSTMVTSLLITVIAAPIARMVQSWYVGRELSVAEACRGMGSSWVSLLVGFVLVHLIEAAATLLLVLPGVAAMAFLMVTAPAIAVERLGPFRGVQRSFRLVRPRFWTVLWIAVLSAVVAGTLSVLLPLLPLAVTSLFGFGGHEYVAAVGTVAASLLTLPFTAAVAVMTYFDLRVRTEGLDLQVALKHSFGEGR
ncbi:MAG: hypothetical protein ACR2N9_02995 [Acidimicrobiia bacterium]